MDSRKLEDSKPDSIPVVLYIIDVVHGIRGEGAARRSPRKSNAIM